MVIIETIRNLIRPGTLAVRLTANIIAGHLLLTLLRNNGPSVSHTLLTVLITAQILLLILEGAVAVIQSYVRHVTYDRRQVNNPRTPYNRRATQRHLGQNYNGRTEGSPPNRRQLNPQVSEFDPTARSSRSDSNSEPVNMTDNESQLLEN